MQHDALVEKLMTIRPDLSAEGVTHVALFGSRARGDHSERSDLDLLLDVDPASRFWSESSIWSRKPPASGPMHSCAAVSTAAFATP
jgi:predicted nucleotidyltransferase